MLPQNSARMVKKSSLETKAAALNPEERTAGSGT